ncbi:arginine deiminase [Bombilactobacillus thymidiniphilus]|uniref:Arginine deiminase n=1 Tax=Bombilactobacillus thymidiniphilus TaxID=2923363 RepID=A0ABY4PBE3_9LACO|nr:arginine deiminase [Bombilactobacillus thymidiniphilus]UQS82997.1 arginine deiminase [Bombilactobacillus thymidiniphilus]
MTEPAIHVTSEIGPLKTVILKRPQAEIENITPDTMEQLLFDDIPYLPIAQAEHDDFAQVLRDHGTKVLYMNELAAQALTDPQIKAAFLRQMLQESGFNKGIVYEQLYDYLLNLSEQAMVDKLIAGVRKKELNMEKLTLRDLAEDRANPFLINPMPNSYFTRDPAAAIGDGLSINHMTFAARQRESLFMQYIIQYNPRFKGQNVPVWRDRNHQSHIEGGDELVLSDHVLAIGLSQRTTASAIEDIAGNLFKNSAYDTVLAISIPHNHAMMHLDTVFTMINYDQFTVHPAILNDNAQLDIYILTPGVNGTINISYRNDLKNVLKEVLHQSSIDLLPTGGGDAVVAPREQWNDGSNTLAIAPGEVVTYDRNYVSNELLRQHGIIVHEVRSSELSRGRGGPRCMSMPIVRDDL